MKYRIIKKDGLYYIQEYNKGFHLLSKWIGRSKWRNIQQWVMFGAMGDWFDYSTASLQEAEKALEKLLNNKDDNRFEIIKEGKK